MRVAGAAAPERRARWSGSGHGVSRRGGPGARYSASRFVSQLKQSQPGRTGTHRVSRR